VALNNFRPQFTNEQLRAVLREKMEIIKVALIAEMEYAGEQGISEARDPSDEEKNYTDRTSNLRKSTGYFIFDNNLVVQGNFQEDDAAGGRFSRGKPNRRNQKRKNATTGANVGRQKAHVIANEYPTGLTFVMVAGMIYGVYVEAKGYNVLTPASLIAETNIKKQFARLVNRINKKARQ
jgi:hypothetical protein